MTNIIIGGDMCPIGKNQPYFILGDARSLFNDLLPVFGEADLSVVNLECPLIEAASPIMKKGPVLGAPVSCINGIKNAGISVLNLANNHIMDHGSQGLSTTLQACKGSHILTVGAGKSLADAGETLITKVGGLIVGIMAVAEHEFSIAREHCWGANPLDIINLTRKIISRRGDVDYLIVLIHGGNEHYPLPSPRLRDLCHFLAETGADAVIVQHTHCPGCFEQYRGSFIVYGQGNLIFDKKTAPNDPWFKGFLVKLGIGDGDKRSLDIIPYIQAAGGVGARRMTDEAEHAFLHEISERSSKITERSYLEEQWLNFCNERRDHYFFGFSAGIINNRIFQKINSYLPFIERLYSDKHLLRLENMVSCESHREIIETLLRNKRERKDVCPRKELRA